MILAVATRPDCVTQGVAELLGEYAARREVWVELGLQTIHEATARAFHRCYPLADYDRAVKLLQQAGVKVVTHLIFGLPEESREDMLASVRYVADIGSWGVKFHLLHILKGSGYAQDYACRQNFAAGRRGIFRAGRLCLRLLRPDMTVHRLTAEAPRELLLAPDWCIYKRQVLNHLQKLLRKTGAYQGEFWWPPQEGRTLP